MGNTVIRQKKVIIPILIITFFLVASILIQPFLLKIINQKLSELSPQLDFHVADIDFEFFEASISLNNFQGKIKENGKQFVNVDSALISFAWGELLRGQVLANIQIKNASIIYFKELPEALKTLKKVEKEKKELPIDLQKVELVNASVVFDDDHVLGKGEKNKISDINGHIINLTPKKNYPLSTFDFKGKIKDSNFKTSGHINTKARPVEWEFDGELKKFDLTLANGFLRDKVPFTFTHGELDLYTEALSEHGAIRGYVKPFMKNLDILKSNENFKGAKHVAVELLSALANLILATSDTKSIATKIPFTFDGIVKIQAQEAAEKAVEHKFEEKIEPGIENQYELKE